MIALKSGIRLLRLRCREALVTAAKPTWQFVRVSTSECSRLLSESPVQLVK